MQRKIKDLKKALNKWDDTHLTIICELIYKLVMLRHTIKMAWFDANCEDKPFKGIKNLEELTEEQQQKRAEERYHLKKLAE